MSANHSHEQMVKFPCGQCGYIPATPGPRGERGPTGEGLSPAVRRAIVALFLIGILIGAANLIFTARTVSTSQRNWCATLDLLTARPAPRPADPEANPSRENTYIFYTDILDLRHRFGCG